MRLWRFVSVFALVLVPLGSHSAPRSEAVGLSALPTVVATVNVGTTPRGVAVDESRNLIYVTNFDDDTGNGVTKIDGATNGASSFSGAVAQPLGIAVNSAANRILVGNYNSNALSIINGTNGLLAVDPLPGVGSQTTGVAFNPLTGKTYTVGLGNGSVFRVNPDNSVKEIVLGGHSGRPISIALNPSLKRAYVTVMDSNVVAVINTDTDEYDSEFQGYFGDVAGIAVNPSSGDIYVANTNAGAVTVLDSGGNYKGYLDINDGQPVAVAVNPNTGHVFVNRYDTNQVYVFNASDVGGGNPASSITQIDVGSGPELGIAVNTMTNMVYVANMNDNTVSVIDDVQKYLQLSTNTLAYATAQGGSIADRQVTISNARDIPMDWSRSIIYDKGAGWLTANPASGTTQSTLTVSINTASLAEDTYTARIVVAATGAVNTPQNINVTLLVNNNLQKLYLPVVGRAYAGSW